MSFLRTTALTSLALVSLLPANEALDLLEGKISEDETTLVPLTGDSASASAAPAGKDEPLVDDTDYSRRWRKKLPPLMQFETTNNPVVQAVAVDGLVEWNYQNGNIDSKDIDEVDVEDNQLRRARLGGMVRAFYNTDLEGRVVLGGNGYQGVDTLKATVQVNENFQVEAGKFRPPFSQEYKKDLSVRTAPDISPLVAQIAPANTLGILATAWSGPWELGLGWFSADVARDIPGFEGSGFILANLSYTFDGEAKPAEGDEETEIPPGHQKWHLDYIHNLDDGQQGSVPKGYEHLISTGIEVSSGRFDFEGDFLLVNGEIDTAWGMNLTGRYWLFDDALRFVGRYGYADTDDDNGLSVPFGVSGALGDATQPLWGYDSSLIQEVNEFHSFYGGLDWHVYDDYLLFWTGLEYRLLKDEVEGDTDSVLWHTGGRVAF